MTQPIHIFGHKNPDADAICSAIGYEAYKHATGQKEYIAARCGNSNARIDAILERFQRPLPTFIGDVTPRLKSIMNSEPRTVMRQNTCAEALEIIDQYDVRALPVLNDQNALEGVISFFHLGEFFIPKPRTPKEMRRVHTSISAIIRSLDAQVLHTDREDAIEELYVRIGAMDIRSFGQHHKQESTPAQNSIIIVGDRWDIQERCLQLGVRLLVITGGLDVDPEVIEHAREANVSLIVSPYDSASTAWIIRTATYIDRLIRTEVPCFAPEDRIRTIKNRIAEQNDPLYMVIDEQRKLLGVFSKSDILRPSTTRIALVDHNELGQAVDGAAEVRITEIIDHHRIGNVHSDHPILFINRPVGSTCSIIADLFRNDGLAPTPEIAGILMAGIISDTLFLNSPTTTGLEKQLLDWLAPIAKEEPKALADLIFSSGSIIVQHSADEVIRSDCKIYDEGELRFSVSQIEELGFDNFRGKAEDLNQALESYRTSENLLFSFLLVTDINAQDSLLLVAGDPAILTQINYPRRGQSNSYDLKGIVSRKKQLMPYIATLLKSSGLLS
ncbi:MAG: putative manganese-dependent inorganic diphosphatase [Coraliomargaritaceae bacterium]